MPAGVLGGKGGSHGAFRLLPMDSGEKAKSREKV
jgi:hypothetical protein